MEYNLTNHARERYAERIMGRTDKADIQTFIAQHEDKIYDDIEKMIEYGEVIYEGQQVRSKDTKLTRYIMRHNWLIVVDPVAMTVITLYKIDLGAGDELNQTYIDTMLNKLKIAKKKAESNTNSLYEIEKSCKTAVEENNELIEDYKRKIKSLTEQNESLQKIIQEQQTNIQIAEEEQRDIVAIMTTGTKF